jgi:hypothetical protein
MSQENVERARRIFEAFNRAFTEGADDLYGFSTRRSSGFRSRPSSRDRSSHGHEGVRRWIEDMKRDWEESSRDRRSSWTWVTTGSGPGRLAYSGRGGDVPLDFPHAAWLAQDREGKLMRMQSFTERQEALEAAGLSE